MYKIAAPDQLDRSVSITVILIEDQFTDKLVKRLDLRVPGGQVETRKSLLYDLSIDESGVATLAVD